MTEQNTPANAEGLSIDKQTINMLDALDVDIHDLASVTGLANEYFETFETGRDSNGFTVCRMTNDQLNRFGYILRTAAHRAKLLHDEYLKAMNGGAA
ncbi:hypothetical protein [Brucella gallinifaecis]|uniref:hypothetical protein n=1 Tax=Brucella gallinifaecis TaxID=215590 RepID=UPI00235DE0E3|nr:hypothetical protein [Brucella gallinifaecis]